MTKKELSKTKDNELITESINTYGRLLQNWSLRLGTKQLEKHWKDCTDEMIKRGIVTKENVEWLNK